MPVTADKDIARILKGTSAIALVGASSNAARPSHRVMRFLLDNGYRVYPVNPRLEGSLVLGCAVYSTLADIPEAVDMVDVFRQPKYLRGIVREAIDIGAKTLWTQLGVVDACAAAVAESAGLGVVMDRCPAIELPRLRAMGLIS